MKKLSLLFATLLVLVSSIIFCSCGDGYKNLKIECEVERIDLVLDDANLVSDTIVFELSGAKSWGEISVVSKPAGMVQTAYQIRDTKCTVAVKALQPTGEGAELIVTHLGSGKSCSVPLNIGMKLQSVTSAGLEFIIQAPEFTDDEEQEVREVAIPTKQLLNCEPANYTDLFVWQAVQTSLPKGIEVVSFDASGKELEQAFEANAQQQSEIKYKGASKAVKTIVRVSEGYDVNAVFKINPISILDNVATLHKDVVVDVSLVDLLQDDDIVVSSATHANNDGVLKDLVLISNPDASNPRKIEGLSGYDFYSTAIIDLTMQVANPVQGEGQPETVLKALEAVNPKFRDLYHINVSTDIEALTLENVDFGKIRAIATSTCVGSGNIKVDFIPNECVGDIKAFSINIPCIVGERATSFSATNNSAKIDITKHNAYEFSSTTALQDSNLYGQPFTFEVLSVNTLDALTDYIIKINKNLLYIDSSMVDAETKTSNYILNSNKESFDLTSILEGAYEYQIAITRDGRQIKFYEQGDYLVSEKLKAINTIYMKWVRKVNGQPLGETNFGITVNNVYDNRYDIKNSEFEDTILTYNIEFNRQRTVESVSYVPVKITTTGGVSFVPANDAGDNWQFYFEPSMLNNEDTYYGFQITEVLGLNSTALTPVELGNINLTISVDNTNLGFALFDILNASVKEDFVTNYNFNFDSDTLYGANIIVIGKIGDKALEYGDYFINISQNNEDVKGTSRDIRLYKNLEASDVSVTLPNAEFEGEVLQYEYVLMTEQPSDWSTTYNTYYEYVGGQYIKVNSGTWSTSKSYYKKIEVTIFDNGANLNLDLSNTYVLATSTEYKVDVTINNIDFVNFNGLQVQAQTVGPTEVVLNNSYVNGLCGKDQDGNNVLRTNEAGSFNTNTNEKNFVKLIYQINTNTYDYYKLNQNILTSITKEIYIYVYEPLVSARFNETQLYKYDYATIPNPELQKQEGKQNLNIILNNNNLNMLNYVDINWVVTGGGVSSIELNSQIDATLTFVNKNATVPATGRIIATLTQFGTQVPIYCDYDVRRAVLSEQVILNTPVNHFNSGEAYINLKVGESLQLDATATTSKLDANGNPLEISFKDEGFGYVICSTTGYSIDGIASIDSNGLLTGEGAGRVKLIIISKDVITSVLSDVTNYFNTGLYIENEAFIMIDVIVSDGSEAYPFLIASASDFRNIANDYYYWDKDADGNDIKVNVSGDTTKINDYHYALVGDIDLSGIPVNFNSFEGTISSFQESYNSNNRFTIYGVMLNENNPNLFTTLNNNSNDIAVLKNINFNVNINYQEKNVVQGDILIGLIGTNKALVENITITVSGKINANNLKNSYIIGSVSAINQGTISITDDILVGVQGSILVNNSSLSKVILGGVVGKNTATIIGANKLATLNNTSNEVEYEVYYDNQGATSDIELQVTGADNTKDASAIGGVVGYNNNGTILNVYSSGKILGVDETNKFSVNNVGGLIGKNDGTNIVTSTIVTRQINYTSALGSVAFTSDNFQIINSYSSAQVVGNNNVGGAVGLDNRGSYKKVYYEVYATQTGVMGNNNVGGLIGNATDSNLYYCYANSFALNYKSSVEVYDIVGQTNVGGLVGLGASTKDRDFIIASQNGYLYSAMNIVSSASSVSVNGGYNVSGIVGKLNNYGAIYTVYFYGVINSTVSADNIHPLVQMYTTQSGVEVSENTPYNNVYAIVNGEYKIGIIGVDDTTGELKTNLDFYQGVKTDSENAKNGFKINNEYNNSYPYIVFKYIDDEGNEVETNLVSVIPTKIEVNQAFEVYYNNHKMFKPNTLGDYIWNGTSYVVYDDTNVDHNGMPRYSLMAECVDTGDTTGNNSDYRAKALVLYYYQFNDMSSENALRHLHSLNTIDMKDIVSDEGIIILPNTLKRFNLRTSNNAVVSVLSGGRLLLNSEGQATITLISTLNPSVSASFVVIVRTKVLAFNLYSSANLRNEYNIANSTINIVKNSSKIIYADFTSPIIIGAYTYDYKQATNMKIKFEISTSTTLATGKTIRDYIRFNELYYDEGSDTYTIPYGTPITITVKEYVDGLFTITATPYVVASYVNNGYNNNIDIPLNNFVTTFNIATKKGASAVNANKNQIDMMPMDDASSVDVKITTDVKVDRLYFSVEALGDIWEVVDATNPNNSIKFVDMLDIVYTQDANFDAERKLYYFDISSESLDISKMLQELSLTIDLNSNANYVDVPFKLQVDLFVFNGQNKIGSSVYINVKPQAITSVMPLNYRIQDGQTEVTLNNAYQSSVIRPGSTNIITIDIAPNIAIYDYVEIIDTTVQDQIFFQQVYVKEDGSFGLVDNMDTWVNSGIKLKKYNPTTSKLYLLARLPLEATANITHSVQIKVYDKNVNVLNTTYLNLEAVMYPAVVMTYAYPNGDIVKADTRKGNIQQQVEANANLAVGVEAEINIQTYNIDEGTLNYSISIMDGTADCTQDYIKLVTLDEWYGTFTLRFDTNNQEKWIGLIGKQVKVSFTASKSLNGITETCKATIAFNIQHMVVHSISMGHTSTQGNLYGDWGEEFETYFYFNYTDISYYYKGYWNAKYILGEFNPDSFEDSVTTQQQMQTIENLLQAFNSWGGNKEMYLTGESLSENIALTNDVVQNSFSIKLNEDKFTFTVKATEPITASDININSLKWVVNFDIKYEGGYPQLTTKVGDYDFSNQFGFTITPKTSPFDGWQEIRTQEEFEGMLEGKFYQLVSNIRLVNYTPLNTAIGGLNGNGYSLIIDSFNKSQLELNYTASAMHIGVFGTLAEDSIIQNLQVCYGTYSEQTKKYNPLSLSFNDSSAIQEQHTNDIYFGGVAGVNLGVITNVRVYGAFSLEASIVGADHIDMGGITAVNGSTSSATKVATITGCNVELSISSMALIGGVSGTNNGKIVNTAFTGKIASDRTNQYVAEVTTAGFVVENTSNGYISLSYVECGIVVGEHNIKSVGRTAGFVLNNAGTIYNCYINQTSLSSQGNIGGFVYQSTGTINNCYAYPTLSNSLFYSEFIYSTNDMGTLTNCYVVTDSTRIINIKGLTQVVTSKLGVQSSYNGFIFAKTNNGIWSISTTGPRLLNSGFNNNAKTYDDIYNIYSVETFEGYLKTEHEVIEGKTFRLVRDLDFENEGLETNPITVSKTLMASFEGNDMALKNYNIYKVEQLDSIGLFAKIGHLGLDIYVRNLILQPTSVKASGAVAVGSLAGIIDGADIYNVTVDNDNMLILGKNVVGGLAGIIKGDFDIMGINSNVGAFSAYKYNIGEQYNLYTGKNITRNTLLDNLNAVSYAGAVAGIVDGYNNANPSWVERTNLDAYYMASDINVSGSLVLIAETVGGAFGLVGERTLVNNLNYNLSSETLYQGVYVSGGLVGENRGIIQNSNIYAYEYVDGVKQDVNTLLCFNTHSRVNGGIVGVNIGGLIDRCTSDITIYTTEDLATAGGIVGRNIEGSIFNSKVYGLASAYFAGGIAGTDYSYNEVFSQTSGFGTATFTTTKVYKAIQNGVKYDSSKGIGELYSNNELTDKFINKFIAKMGDCYSFNASYMDNKASELISASSIFGLVVGLTDENYITTYTYDNNLVITLQRGTPSSERTEYKIGYLSKTQTIKPLANVVANLTYDANFKVMFMYVIAYTNASFEFWSSTLGYGDDYLAFSEQPLTVNENTELD